MGLIFLFVLGAALGWLATVVGDSRRSRNLMRNLGVGILGALAGGLLFDPLIGGGGLLAGSYRIESLLLALIVSALALFSVNLLHRSEIR